MKELLINALTVAYGVTGLVTLIGYWPTITDLCVRKKASANISSYMLWTATNGISFLYAIFVLPNLLLRIVTGTNFLACLIVLILSVSLSRRHAGRVRADQMKNQARPKTAGNF